MKERAVCTLGRKEQLCKTVGGTQKSSTKEEGGVEQPKTRKERRRRPRGKGGWEQTTGGLEKKGPPIWKNPTKSYEKDRKGKGGGEKIRQARKRTMVRSA